MDNFITVTDGWFITQVQTSRPYEIN